MTRRHAAMAAIAVAVALAGLPLKAQTPGDGFGPGQGPGQRMGGLGRGRGPGGPGGPMGILPGLNQVGLSDAQREQFRTIMEQERPSDDPAGKVRQAEEALHAAVLAEVPDAGAIEAAKAALNAAHATELDHRVQVMQKIAQILTPAQRQQLAQLQPPPGRGR